MIEIEVKARIEDPKQIERTIISFGAVPIGIENHVDTYYNTDRCDFRNTDEALRIRAQEGEYFLTYKGPKMDAVSKTRKEFEVKIEDAAEMGNILSSLGFYPVATIVKKRKKYKMEDLSIALDEVRNLGYFMEIEIQAKNPSKHEEKVGKIFKFIEKLGINKSSTVRESYLEMLLGER
ncbi:MAG TPA: class IV adenylate cyclase [Candidatus Methanoperedens sp.]